MELKEGKFYRTRDGRKVGPMKLINASDQWKPCSVGDVTLSGMTWDGAGRRYYDMGREWPQDLIAEWSDDTPRPWSELTREERGEISLAFIEGKTIQLYGGSHWGWNEWEGKGDISQTHQPVRIKPELEVETVTLYGCFDGKSWVFNGLSPEDYDTHKIVFITHDGEPDADSIEMEKI